MRFGRILPALGLLVVGGLGGIIFSGAFASFVEYSSTLEFCTSCHEMESTVYQEYKETHHYENRVGVRAICSDCHVPHHNWMATVWKKINATSELYHHFMGKLDTREKFEEHRLEMAQSVWASMQANDSATCRNCHSMQAMVFDKQRTRSATQHKSAIEEGKTCIDCHKGIAHKEVEVPGEEEEAPQDFTF